MRNRRESEGEIGRGEDPGSDACERKERRALPWPGHGGVKVAAGGRSLGAWRGMEAPARGDSGSRVQGGDAWGGGEAGLGLRPAQSGGRAAHGTGGETEQASRQGKGKTG